jgi:stage III sporulation protein AG
LDKLRLFLKNTDGKKLMNIFLALVAGIIFLIISNLFFSDKKNDIEITAVDTANRVIETKSDTYEEKLEGRLEDALALVEGVGKLKVLLTLSYSSEIFISQDITTDEQITKESDNEGGTREISSKKADTRNIIINENGSEKPLVLKEATPKVEGVIIVAEGGGSPVVKESLANAVSSVLGIEIYKIQVLKMKS